MLHTRKSLITEVRGITGGAQHLHKPPGWECCAQTIEKLHHRKSQSIFSEASQTEWHEPFDFQPEFSGFPVEIVRTPGLPTRTTGEFQGDHVCEGRIPN